MRNENDSRVKEETEGTGTAHPAHGTESKDSPQEACEETSCAAEASMTEMCQLHGEMSRRVADLETSGRTQVDENAKIWKAINTIREEKAKDSTVLAELVVKVDKIDGRLEAWFRELREELEKLKAVPGKRWENLVSDVLKEVVALVIGIIVTYLALKGGP